MYFFQVPIMFPADDSDPSQCTNAKLLGVEFKTVEFKEEKIRFFHYEKENSDKTIIILHGNAGSACDRMEYVYKLQDMNMDIMLYEYPGYAGDDTKISEKNIYKNSMAFIEYLQTENMINPKFTLYGESIGSGFVTYLAANLKDVDTLILQSPFPSITKVASGVYPYLPVSLILKNKVEASKYAIKVKAKTYVFYAKEDNLIDPKLSKEAYSFFNNKGEIYGFENRDHNQIHYNNSEYWDLLKSILNKNID